VDQFNGQKARCKRCVVKRREIKKKGKPEPFCYPDDSVIPKSIGGCQPKTLVKLRWSVSMGDSPIR
jgi:hypothetical protein